MVSSQFFPAGRVASVEEQVERGVYGGQAILAGADASFPNDPFGAHEALGNCFRWQ